MIKTKYYELSVEGLQKIKSVVINIGTLVVSDDLKKYIAKKCSDEVFKISLEHLNEITNDEADGSINASNYLHSFGSEIRGDCIFIYNNAVIDMAEVKARNPNMDISKYPPQLSLAKIVEYGIGYTGNLNTKKTGVDNDWQYDVNEHGYKGWYYHDRSGNLHWTNGYEGKLIFYRLRKVVRDEAPQWVSEYFDKNIKL